MKSLLTVFLILSATLFSMGQKKKKQDVAAIKSMCGCYEVTFNFAETFAPDKEYAFHDNYRAAALEYVLPVEESKDKIVMQHLLVVRDTMVIKHWRQDWLYENTDLYVFDKENAWKYESLSSDDVKGQWTQKVYQVGDGPRYEGTATWIHVDGKHFWESTAFAPLPRREYTKRNDYNVMERTNRHEITDNGWLHEQDNRKIVREGSVDELLAEEKGMNTYTKVERSECQAAIDWWASNHRYWDDVRAIWGQLFEAKKDIALEAKVDGRALYRKLFALEEEMLNEQPYNSAKAREEITSIIDSYLVNDYKWAMK